MKKNEDKKVKKDIECVITIMGTTIEGCTSINIEHDPKLDIKTWCIANTDRIDN